MSSDRKCNETSCNIGFNSNNQGGRAYFLYPSATAADGTFMTASEEIMRLFYGLKLPYDVICAVILAVLIGGGTFLGVRKKIRDKY